MVVVVALVLLVVGGITWAARDLGWAALEPAVDRTDRMWAYVVAYIALAPATFVYLVVLAVTTWVLRSSNAHLSQGLLASHSTNLDNLHRDPVGALVTSAFWLDSAQVARWVVLFTLVMAPLERWLGTLRAIVAFATGHVVATLIVAFVLEHDLISLAGDDLSRRSIDVGASYGFFCIAALFTYRLRGRRWWAWAWAAALVVYLGVPFATGHTYTDLGHLIAASIGFALYPLSRAPVARARSIWPIWKPPSEIVDATRASIAARGRARHPLRGQDRDDAAPTVSAAMADPLPDPVPAADGPSGTVEDIGPQPGRAG